MKVNGSQNHQTLEDMKLTSK